jgi:hypothetical protein
MAGNMDQIDLVHAGTLSNHQPPIRNLKHPFAFIAIDLQKDVPNCLSAVANQ